MIHVLLFVLPFSCVCPLSLSDVASVSLARWNRERKGPTTFCVLSLGETIRRARKGT